MNFVKKLFPFFAAVLLLAGCASPKEEALVPRKIFYAGPEGGVKTALSLAGYSITSDPARADVFVLNGELPTGVADQTHDKGLVLILGNNLSTEDLRSYLGKDVSINEADGAVSLVDSRNEEDPLQADIVWNGAPQVRERIILSGLPSGTMAIITAFEDKEGILFRVSDRVLVFTPILANGTNPQIQEWGYFNYFIYALVEDAAGAAPMAFADYPASPVPHAADRNALFVFLGIELAVFYGAFILVRRYSLRHPEALDSLVSDSARFKVQEERTGWEKVGFHRPLSGLLVGMGIGILMFIPLIIYQNLILPQFILPSAQALGMWGRVTQLFGLTWAIWDVGTSMASMKFLSQYRVSDPRRGYQYLQVFVWWQALSGALQVALVVALTSLGVVRSPYALFAWSIVVHSLIQIPGFFGVFRSALNGLQRTDYARYIDSAGALLMPILVQIAVVPVFYVWGKTNPVMGGAMGGALGLGVAAYAIEICLFLMGFWLYKRLGYRASVLFLAHFDWKIIKETFRFGFFEMLGGMTVAAGGALEIWITQKGLINYSETWGNWLLAGNFLLAFTISTNLFDGVMPAISEALSSGYKKLCQYYSAQSYKWGAVCSAALAAILLVVAPRFILGSSGMEFQRAAVLAIPLSFFGSIQFLSWLGDALFLGANRPFLRAGMVLGEQAIRISLMVILLARFQIEALIIAYFVGILARGIVAYFVADKYCFPQRFYFWQSLAAPVIAGGLHYLFLSLIAKFVWQGEEISSIILFFIGLVPAMPVFFFFYALAGGWDDAGLEEVIETSKMTGFLRPVVNIVFIVPSKWGARISPLHNRFPISIRDTAMQEAAMLTRERAKLVEE